MSPVQPQEVPPNLQFEVDDACSEWTFTKNSFDFVHIRALYGCVADWPAMYGQIMEYVTIRQPCFTLLIDGQTSEAWRLC